MSFEWEAAARRERARRAGAEPVWIDARDFNRSLDTEDSIELERLRGRLSQLREIEREFVFVSRDDRPNQLPSFLARGGLECSRCLSRLNHSERRKVEPLVRRVEAEYCQRMRDVVGTSRPGPATDRWRE